MAGSFPEWLRRPWASGPVFSETKELIERQHLHTVCQSARCPNMGECWAKGTATVMVLGNTCTRNCTFCSVDSGRPESIDPGEPRHVAEAVRAMKLKHAVVTTVVRDDLPDAGAGHIAQTIREIHALCPDTSVEILVSDFDGTLSSVDVVLDAFPEVFCHNIETVRRLYDTVRDRRFSYQSTLDVLRHARAHPSRSIVKSALMVGHGETPDDVEATLRDLFDAGCEAVCIGQYLRPTKQQRSVVEFVTPDQFRAYEEAAYAIGFSFVMSGPFVRSSYRSEELLEAPFARERLAAREGLQEISNP